MRVAVFFVLLAVVLCLPFVIWGDAWEARWSLAAVKTALEGSAWGWLLVPALLVGDLVLPVPSTVVMSGAGYVYGWWWGGVLAAAGSFLSGAVAYLLCRRFGEAAARRLMGPDDYTRGCRFFAGEAGPWLVAVSRCLPLLPETVACMAGLTRMPAGRYFTALACGSLPLGFVFAAVGASGHDRPGLALALSAVLPVILHLVSRAVRKRS